VLPVVKRRQLTHQIGTFGEFAFESSMDLDITMVFFPVVSTFIFGSWICTVDDSGKLQRRLMEISADQASLASQQEALGDLVQTTLNSPAEHR
jgi:hypothetical protein